MQEDEEGANYSYDIPIDELLDSVSDGEKEAVEEKPGLGSVPHQLDEPQEVVVNHEPGSFKAYLIFVTDTTDMSVVEGGGYHGSHLLCQTVKYRVSGLGSGTRWTSGRVGLPVPTRLSFENHRVAGNSKYRGQTVSSGYPNPTRYPVFHLLPDPTD